LAEDQVQLRSGVHRRAEAVSSKRERYRADEWNGKLADEVNLPRDVVVAEEANGRTSQHPTNAEMGHLRLLVWMAKK